MSGEITHVIRAVERRLGRTCFIGTSRSILISD